MVGLNSLGVPVGVEWCEGSVCLFVSALLRGVRLESIVRDVVQADQRLVGILHD